MVSDILSLKYFGVTTLTLWLRASQLRLNPTKTQVMWLGSIQQLTKLDITHVRVLSSCVAVQDTARELGVVIDSQLSLSAYVTVEVASTSRASCSRLSGCCRKLRVRHWSRHSFSATWTTATRCSSASQKDWWTGCSRFRTPLPIWWPVLDAPAVYRRCSVSYTGYQCASVSTSRWLRSFTSHCLAFRHHTWPTTAISSPTLVIGGVPQQAKHASWRGHTAPSATERSRLPAPDYGTVCHRTWKMLTCRAINPAVVKDISVWTVGPLPSVNFINCTDDTIHTYIYEIYA